MDVVSHNAEIPQAEMKLLFRSFDERKKQLLESRLKQSHVVMVNFRRDMIGRSVLECSQASHTYI
jgi:hypothetical protein